MIYLISHVEREGTGNPKNIPEALLKFETPIVKKYIFSILTAAQVVVVGEAERFREVYKFFCAVFPFVLDKRKISSPVCGTAVSRDRNGDYVMEDDTRCREEDRIKLEDLGIDLWELFLKKLPDNSVLFSGAEFMRGLGISDCHICSIWALDVQNKGAYCIVKGGKVVGNLPSMQALQE